ncbi:uncharacterized protein LOC143034126 [Oratosquilla oratoria]|uniref:uncharacterized protein LOC143034126 n=1 Tax=Oratosquilla oratoria TaxID=337810 RepID=UPI003F777D73
MADIPAMPTMPTMPTYGHPTVFVYPTVSPRVVVVPILSCIFGFPVLVMIVICGLRYRAQRARMRAKKAKGLDFSMMEFSVEPSIPLRYTNGKMQRSSLTKKKTLVR